MQQVPEEVRLQYEAALQQINNLEAQCIKLMQAKNAAEETAKQSPLVSQEVIQQIVASTVQALQSSNQQVIASTVQALHSLEGRPIAPKSSTRPFFVPEYDGTRGELWRNFKNKLIAVSWSSTTSTSDAEECIMGTGTQKTINNTK